MDNLMRKNNLAIIKSDSPFMRFQSLFEPNKFYRSIQLSEGDDNAQILITGEVFTQVEFNELFEYATDRVLRDWNEIGLLKNGKALSFTAFGKQADINEYTSFFMGRRTKMRILLFRTSKDIIYGFYPTNVTKLGDIKESYQWYLDTVTGITEHLNDKLIQFGNRGIPMSYCNLGVWKETPKPFVL